MALVAAAGCEIEIKAIMSAGNETKLWAELQTKARDFRSDIAALAARPGDAFCENMLLCYFAGKPLIIDPFNSAQLVMTGKLSDQVLASFFLEGKFSTVQLDNADPEYKERFTPLMLRSIKDSYSVNWTSSDGVFYSHASSSSNH